MTAAAQDDILRGAFSKPFNQLNLAIMGAWLEGQKFLFNAKPSVFEWSDTKFMADEILWESSTSLLLFLVQEQLP